MKYLLLFFLLSSCVTCGLQNDITNESWTNSNYYSSHMVFEQRNYWGITTINLAENEPLPRDSITIKLFSTGSINFFSRACELNYSDRFSGDYLFKLTKLRNCEITFTIIADKVGMNENEVTEKGLIVTFVKPNNTLPMLINGSQLVTSIQVVEGTPSQYEMVTIVPHSKSGVLIGNSSENKSFELEYTHDLINLPLSRLQCVDNSSCTWIFRAIPEDADYTRIGLLKISVFKGTTLPLERISVKVRKNRMEFTTSEYVIISSINGKLYYTHNFSIKFEKDKEYTVTTLTKIGRKSVSIFKNGVLIW